MDADRPYKPPATEDFEHEDLRISNDERDLLAKCRVYMFLLAMGGWILSAIFAYHACLQIYAWVTWEDGVYEWITRGYLLQLAAGRILYIVAFGAVSYTLWKWAVSIRVAYTDADESITVAWWQLCFLRAVVFLVLVILLHLGVWGIRAAQEAQESRVWSDYGSDDYGEDEISPRNE